jgi:nucleolar MIF4G domain-containing protein 1
MIETLTNLKNNKSKRNVTQNQGGAAVERMKKFLSGLSKTRHGMTLPRYRQVILVISF